MIYDNLLFIAVALGSCAIAVLWLYFFLHAIQWTRPAHLRAQLVLWFLLMNILYIAVYFFQVYRHLPKSKRRLITRAEDPGADL